MSNFGCPCKRFTYVMLRLRKSGDPNPTLRTTKMFGGQRDRRKIQSRVQAQFAPTVCRHGAEGALTSLGEALDRLDDESKDRDAGEPEGLLDHRGGPSQVPD